VLGITLAQEFFVLQVLRVFLLHVVAMKAIKPQLQSIYRALYNVTQKESDQPDNGVSFNACQSLFATLRATHSAGSRNSPTAMVLSRMDDVNIVGCQFKNSEQVGISVMAMFGLPTMFAMIGDGFSNLALNWWFPAIFDAILLMNFYFWQGAGFTIFIPYGVLLIVVLLRKHMNVSSDSEQQRNAGSAYRNQSGAVVPTEDPRTEDLFAVQRKIEGDSPMNTAYPAPAPTAAIPAIPPETPPEIPGEGQPEQLHPGANAGALSGTEESRGEGERH